MRHTGLFVNLWRPCPNYALPERPVQPNGVSIRTERVADTIGLCRDRTADGEARQVGPSRRLVWRFRRKHHFARSMSH